MNYTRLVLIHNLSRNRHLTLIAGAAAHTGKQEDTNEPSDWTTVLLCTVLLLHYIDHLLSIGLRRARCILWLRLVLSWGCMLLLCILRVVRWLLRVCICHYIGLL